MKRLLAPILVLAGCTGLMAPTPAAPIGDSMFAGPYVASILYSEEPRVGEVPRRPDNDRYRLTLVLHSLDGKPARSVPLKGGLRSGEFMPSARMLGDDGRLIWFHAHETMAYDYRTGKLLSGAALPRAGEPQRPFSQRNPQPREFRAPAGALCSGCKRPALLLSSPNGIPVTLTGPNSVLVLHRSNSGVFGTELISRTAPDGKTLWTVDTGLQDITQILPSDPYTVFLGQQPPEAPDAFRPAYLVIVNNQSGTATTHPLGIIPR